MNGGVLFNAFWAGVFAMLAFVAFLGACGVLVIIIRNKKMKITPEIEAEARQARVRYEQGMTVARHARDEEISRAWCKFEEAMAIQWAAYMRSSASFEEALKSAIGGDKA